MKATPEAQASRTGLKGKAVVPGTSILLAVTIFLVFNYALRCDFLNYDDPQYFSTNPHVQAGLTWPNVAWALTTRYASNWHPLTWLSLMLDVDLFGPGPAGPHLTNVALHAANTVLVFLLLKGLTGAHWRSAFVAALFGLHPLHVESVAWVSERKDVLSAFFGLLTLITYGRYAAESKAHDLKSRVLYGLALLFFVLGLMSKPMLVTLPFVMLLLDWWPLGRYQQASDPRRQPPLLRLAVEKLPFLALCAASSAVTLVAQRGAVQSLGYIPLSIRTVNAIDSYGRYLWKTIWPVDLAIPYPYHGYGNVWLFFLATSLLLGITVAVMRFGRVFPFLLVGWLWYLGMLVPTIGLVQVGTQSMADRYTYLPLIGVFIIAAWGAGEFTKRWRLPQAAIWCGAFLILSLCTSRTLDQLAYWKNSGTLFGHSIEVTRVNDVAQYNLGFYCAGRGELDEAMNHYLEAIRINPSYDDALNNLGVALAMEGQTDEAIARIRESIRYAPRKADAYYNLGNVFVMQHKLDDAANAYTEALRLKPDYPEAHNNIGNIYAMQGRRDLAVEHYREALRLNPKHEGARRALNALGAAPGE
jgi:Tfp pilus assembly protein PilF